MGQVLDGTPPHQEGTPPPPVGLGVNDAAGGTWRRSIPAAHAAFAIFWSKMLEKEAASISHANAGLEQVQVCTHLG